MIKCTTYYYIDDKSSEMKLTNNPEENINYYCANFELEKKGLYNIGNSCYINSFLQILLHIPQFLYNLKKEYQNTNKKSPLIENIINLSKYPNNKKYLYLIQEYMNNISPNYSPFHQADSQTFGIDLINEIITSIKGDDNSFETDKDVNFNKKNTNKKKAYTKYVNKYQNTLISLEKMFLINECFNINNKNIIKYSFFTNLNIELVFPNKIKTNYNLKDLLNFKYNNTSKKICKIPKVIIITIVRSFINRELISTSLEFPEELNISDYTDKDLIIKNECLKFKLFAINEKEGIFKKNGHYYCLIQLRNEWYKFDDRKVNKINRNSNEAFFSRNVVGLFYII